MVVIKAFKNHLFAIIFVAIQAYITPAIACFDDILLEKTLQSQRNSLLFFIHAQVPAAIALARFSEGANSLDISRSKELLGNPMRSKMTKFYLGCKLAQALLDNEQLEGAIDGRPAGC